VALRTVPSLTDISSRSEYWAKGYPEQDKVIIKVVDVDYDEACGGEILASGARNPVKGGSHYDTFYGYMRTTPGWLQEVWKDLMENQWMFIFRNQDTVFKGYL
jgi:hypothetical protein